MLSDWEPIRIKADYSCTFLVFIFYNDNNCLQLVLDDLSKPHRDYLQHVLIPSAIQRIQGLYSVNRYNTPLKTPANQTMCNGRLIPSQLSTVGIPNTDLYILVLWVNDPSSNFIAKALACALDSTTSRYIISEKFIKISIKGHILERSNLTQTI